MPKPIEKPWYQNAVLYHIYPLSFADSNGDGFGDIKGIIDHLDYLQNGHSDSLGVGAVWLSPIYLSPMADWGYDVADYRTIDPRFGTMTDFDSLVRGVHKRGMKLLMDYIPNHTSILHEWFSDARMSKAAAKRDWYIWADAKPDGRAPNNWLSYFGGSAWTWDEHSGQYYLHSFLPQQPDLNWRSPQVREEMLNVLRFWLARGVDGFRTDAAYGLVKDDQLRDDPPNPSYRPGISDPAEQNLRVHSAGQSTLPEVIGAFCDVLAEKADTFLLSEVYLNIPGLHELYQACIKHPIHAPFNFNLMSLSWGASSYRDFIDEYEASLGVHDWPNYVLGNHDRHRLVTRVGPARARILAMLQMTLRGLPVIYYGDELGMADVRVPARSIRDPWEIRVPGLGLGRDGSRTPMPWTDDVHGFTAGEPWLPMGSAIDRINVAREERDPDSVLAMYRHLISLRQTCPAFLEGTYQSLDLTSPNVFGYSRKTDYQEMMVILNFDQSSTQLVLSKSVGTWVAGTHEVMGDGAFQAEGLIKLRPYEGRVYELNRIRKARA
jgi:alpha-glucosidase